MVSYYGSSTYDDSNGGSITTNDIKEIWYGNYVHPEINTRDTRLKIRECIRKIRSEWKGVELSEKRMGKGLHKLFKDVVNELNNPLPTLV